MYLQKTPQGVAELSAKERTLSLKERALLLLANGKKSDAELLALVTAAEPLMDALVAQGYLVRTRQAAQPVQAATPQAPGTRASVDPFEGKRSLATARMFLFDLTERLLARRDPPLSRQLRANLREARDRDTMLDVARDLLRHVEAHAGAARADDISARLAMLLPDEVAA